VIGQAASETKFPHSSYKMANARSARPNRHVTRELTLKKSESGRVVWWLVALLSFVLIFCGLAFVFRIAPSIRVGTAVVSQTLCGGVFVSGLPVDRVYAEEVKSNRGLRILVRRLNFTLDPTRKSVVTTWAGHFPSTATYTPEYGCLLGDPDSLPTSAASSAATTEPPPTSAVTTASPTEDSSVVIPPTNPKLAAALDTAFAEIRPGAHRQVRAIVIMRDGKIIAERYAPGITTETPLLAYSVSKSVINALIGILVSDGKLDVNARAPVQAWAATADPRNIIALDELMRMTSGLNLTENDTGLDPVSRMLFRENDMAAFAERAQLKAAPGSTFEYTSGNTLITSSIVRDAVGGRAEDVRRFAATRLFDPVGMRHVAMDFDHAGTPVGSTRFYASARDWARFGQLYLDDGVVNGKRILPQGWVAYSTRPTLDSDYGAGFWVNAGNAEDAQERIKAGMPADSFYASGNFGQRIVVIPSQHLVIVRFGVTQGYPGLDIHGLLQLVSDVIAAQ
jgi:CubicO group peptidase (beta-lactamase class C family)